MATRVRVKRVYEVAEDDDGVRVLVDRLWPRGLTKAAARVDHWLKSCAPSTELRRWFGHDPARWEEFQRRYLAELARQPEGFEQLLALAHSESLTLLYAARDTAHNHALVLRRLLAQRLRDHTR